MATLGQDLRRERELRNVSIQEIAEATKISARLLEAVEKDRWEALPGPFFVKGVLRAYARAIDLDPEAIVDRFHRETMGAPEAGAEPEERVRAAPIRREPERPAFVPASRRRRIPRGAAAGAIAALAVVLGGGAYLVLKLNRPAALPAMPRAFQAPPLTVPALPVETAAAAVPKPAAAEPEPSGLRLELSFQAETWIHAAADGVVVFVGNKPAGSTAVWTAENEIVLQTGNAGGLTFDINGRRAKPLGRSGEVRTDIRIGLDNYKSFLAEPEIRAAEAS